MVRLLVEMLEPLPDKTRGIEGRVHDPCCGLGGMFIQSEKFMEEHGGRIGGIAIYGQESNYKIRPNAMCLYSDDRLVQPRIDEPKRLPFADGLRR